MSKIISEIVDRLKTYQKVDYEVSAESICVNPKDDNGFHVSLTDNGNGNFTVAFDFWHEEFDNENDAIRAESQARLKGTVGGVQGVLQIQTSVSQGTTQYEAGIEILKDIYGYEDEQARRVLGEPIQQFSEGEETVDEGTETETKTTENETDTNNHIDTILIHHLCG